MTPMSGTTDAFSFEHEGRTFTCCVEGTRASARGPWWWFAVSTEVHQRHAPFPALATDSEPDVRARMIAYYDALVARRNAPYVSRWQGRPVNRAAAAPQSEAVPPAA